MRARARARSILSFGLSLCLAQGLGSAVANAAPALTLAVKFVEFKDSGGKVPLTQEQAAQLVSAINSEYAQCGIALRLEQYQQIDPAAVKLPYHLSSMSQLDRARIPFDDPREIVVINTGSWDHAGMGPANAWTSMPGDRPAGAVIEGPVAGFTPIVAHELGHYLSLEHVSNNVDMMNPITYPDSTRIDSRECEAMVATARKQRAGALRGPVTSLAGTKG